MLGLKDIWKAFWAAHDRRRQKRMARKIEKMDRQIERLKVAAEAAEKNCEALKVDRNIEEIPAKDRFRVQMARLKRGWLTRRLAETQDQQTFQKLSKEMYAVEPEVQRSFKRATFFDVSGKEILGWISNYMRSSVLAAIGIGLAHSFQSLIGTNVTNKIETGRLTLNTAISSYFSQKAAKTMTPLERKFKDSDFIFRRADRIGWFWPWRLTQQVQRTVALLVAAVSAGIALLTPGGSLHRLGLLAGLATIPILPQLVIAPWLWIKKRGQNTAENKVWDRNKKNLNVLLGEAVLLNPQAFNNASQKQLVDALVGNDVLKKYKKELGWLQAVPSILASLVSLGVLSYALLYQHMGIGTSVSMWTSCTGFMSASLSLLTQGLTLLSIKQSLLDHYADLQASKVYELTYGRESLDNGKEINAICLDKISYKHRFRSEEKRGQKGNGVAFVSDETIFIEPGITIVGGETGIGKTTLFNVLRQIDDVDGGCIAVGHKNGDSFSGTKLTELKKGELGNLIGVSVSAADFHALDEQTVLDIAKMQNPGVSDLAVQTLADMLNMGDKLYSETGEPRTYNSLSDGERRRVLLIQALLSDKMVTILDEPTTGVDAATAALMMKVIDVVSGAAGKNRFILITSHDPKQYLYLRVNPYALELHKRKSDGIPVLETYPVKTPEDMKNYIELCNNRVVEIDKKNLPENAAIVVQEMRKASSLKEEEKKNYKPVEYDKEKAEQETMDRLTKSNVAAWLVMAVLGRLFFRKRSNMRGKLAEKKKGSKTKGKEKGDPTL